MTVLLILVALYLVSVVACAWYAHAVRGSQVAPWGQLLALACLWPLAALAMLSYRAAAWCHRARGVTP